MAGRLDKPRLATLVPRQRVADAPSRNCEHAWSQGVKVRIGWNRAMVSSF
jgi:hypothetical protein